jgi:hypothetical protein
VGSAAAAAAVAAVAVAAAGVVGHLRAKKLATVGGCVPCGY